ncbi:MAG TPA: hypothetical protein VM282_27835 [Acidimicrobiales bacterium]|nr:hypothetical protein [Acidimicrobiales bacterium]
MRLTLEARFGCGVQTPEDHGHVFSRRNVGAVRRSVLERRSQSFDYQWWYGFTGTAHDHREACH